MKRAHTWCGEAWNSVEWYFLGSCSHMPALAEMGRMCSLTAAARRSIAVSSPRGNTMARTGTDRGCRAGSTRPSRRRKSDLESKPCVCSVPEHEQEGSEKGLFTSYSELPAAGFSLAMLSKRHATCPKAHHKASPDIYVRCSVLLTNVETL